jgi:glycosyltransferase involved in cell wall biosynthesis
MYKIFASILFGLLFFSIIALIRFKMKYTGISTVRDSGGIEIVHYCCGSYDKDNFGGVARYDYQISLAFPNRVFFQGPSEKKKMLAYLKRCKNPLVITDNHLSCDVPNQYNILLVHHGVAQTHAEREPGWNAYWRDLCCNGQKRMLSYRDPQTTTILSVSKFCTDEFTRLYPTLYPRFSHIDVLHCSELDENRYKKKKSWNDKPIVLGNWNDNNKGLGIVDVLKTQSDFIFQDLKVSPRNNDITDFNKRKQDIYLDCDIFLQISLSEGNSYSTLDALLCGLPIVASNVGLFMVTYLMIVL